jgi:hypothetical protein
MRADKIMNAIATVIVVAVVLALVAVLMHAHPEWWNPSYWGIHEHKH